MPAVFGLSGTIKLKWTKGRAQKSAPTVEGSTNVQRGWVGPIARRWPPPVLASPANAQGETETLWPRPKMLRLNFRSLLSWICSVVALLGWSLSFFCRAKPTRPVCKFRRCLQNPGTIYHLVNALFPPLFFKRNNIPKCSYKWIVQRLLRET